MNNKCLAGINKDTGVVDIVLCLEEDFKVFLQDIDDIESDGCYAIIADKELADEALGKKIDSPQDIVRAAGQSPKQGELL